MSDLPTDKRDTQRRAPSSAHRGRLVSRVAADCIEVTIRNVCSTGMGLILNQAVDTTQVEAVALEGIGADSPLEIGIRAVYCVEGKDGPYILGAKFVRELSDAELMKLVSM